MTDALQAASVPHILIRDLTSSVHAVLQKRAEGRGKSLQQYLTAELQRLAQRPTVDEVLQRISSHTGGQAAFDQALADLTAARQEG